MADLARLSSLLLSKAMQGPGGARELEAANHMVEGARGFGTDCCPFGHFSTSLFYDEHLIQEVSASGLSMRSLIYVSRTAIHKSRSRGCFQSHRYIGPDFPKTPETTACFLAK